MFDSSPNKKMRRTKFPELDQHILNYIRESESKLSQFGIGLSWDVVCSKAVELAQFMVLTGSMTEEEFDTLKFSNGWLHSLKKQYNLSCVKLVGEANTMSETESLALLTQLKMNLSNMMNELAVPHERVLNADQTGLYYRRVPSTTICTKDRQDVLKGTKQMKDKERITIMVCSSSEGTKLPLAFIGTSKKPQCFEGRKKVENYTNNSKAWFTKDTTAWWFKTVFVPFYMKKYYYNKVRNDCGNKVPCAIVILDGCSAHNDIQSYLNMNNMDFIHIIYLPPNVTSKYQPMDQGVISWMKKGYKYNMIKKILFIVENTDTFMKAINTRRGCGYDGFDQGCKPHIYDAIELMNYVWDKIGEDSIKKCWEKSKCVDFSINNCSDDNGALPCGENVTDEDLVDILNNLKITLANVDDEKLCGDFAGSIVDETEDIESMVDVVEIWNTIDSHDGEVISETLDMVKEAATKKIKEVIAMGGTTIDNDTGATSMNKHKEEDHVKIREEFVTGNDFGKKETSISPMIKDLHDVVTTSSTIVNEMLQNREDDNEEDKLNMDVAEGYLKQASIFLSSCDKTLVRASNAIKEVKAECKKQKTLDNFFGMK